MDPLSESIWCYKREDKDNSLMVLANLTPDTVAIDDYFGEEERWRLLYGNYDSTQNSVDSLRPYECMWWIK
jgi:trehalose-6-phosphate hydrolase